MATIISESQTPLGLVRLWKYRATECYDALDDLRDYWLNSGMPTHSACDIPISAAATWLVERLDYTREEMARDAAELTACYIWRKYKIIYSFDNELANELSEQANDYTYEDSLTVDILLHPPYPCVYIHCPGILGINTSGFFAWIEFDVNRSILEFRVSYLPTTMDHTVPVVLELTSPTLGECVASTLSETAKQAQAPQKFPNVSEINRLLTALNMYLYICSDGADVQPNPEQSKITRRSSVICDKFREVEVQDVGFRIGAVLRKTKTSNQQSERETGGGSHTAKRQHIRRGHWHHYWTGSRSAPEERKLILKWTHPMLVGGASGNNNDSVTVFPIKP
jgi:hypothetical protein